MRQNYQTNVKFSTLEDAKAIAKDYEQSVFGKENGVSGNVKKFQELRATHKRHGQNSARFNAVLEGIQQIERLREERVSQEHPEAHLELLERPTSEMFRLVADNTVDFAIMNTNLNTPDYLTTETILYEKILLVGNRGNRAAQALAEACRAGREPELSVLEHERFVLLYPEILLAMRVNNFLEREHITVENALYTTNATTALNLTAENYGFCFVNETAVHNAPNRGELLFFDLDSPDLVHPLSVVYKKKRHLLPAARAFVDAARRFLQSQSWRSECDCRVEHGRPV